MPAATVALTVGILSNTTFKLSMALIVGRGRFRVTTAVVLGGMAVATALTLVAN